MKMSKNRCRYRIQRLDNYVGFVNTCTHKRVPNLYPNKHFREKVRATAYIGGYAYRDTTDLHYELRGKKTVSREQYLKLKKKYPTRM